MPSTLATKISLCVLIIILAMALVQSAQAQVETILYNFTGTNGDGANPLAGLLMDSKGNLYGTTSFGGSSACNDFGCGTVFKLSTSLKETVVYSFASASADGFNPYGNVIRDSAGNLYGTTFYGGSSGLGVVFKVDTAGVETILHDFTGGDDGQWPATGLLMDSSGNLYGTTAAGGGSSNCNEGCGVVFKIDTAGTESILHSFTGAAGGGDGAYPYGNLIMDAKGNLYGTTTTGGADGYDGTVFEIPASGGEKVLYSFKGLPDGASPQGGLVMDSSGNLYGTTTGGGSSGLHGGTVFKLTSSGQETILYNFTAENGDGSNPTGTLIRDNLGNLYGTTQYGGDFSCYEQDGCGIVFRVSSTGVETILHTFAGGTDGEVPNGSLVMDADGNLYGTTMSAGSGTGSLCQTQIFNTLGCGTVFKITMPNFTITASPTTASVTPGESAKSTLTIAPVADYSAKVTLSCSMPADKGLSCSVSPSSVTLNGLTSEKATLTVATLLTTPAGSYTITAKGLAGLTLTHTATFTVTVQ